MHHGRKLPMPALIDPSNRESLFMEADSTLDRLPATHAVGGVGRSQP
jgi:hypothetical protein